MAAYFEPHRFARSVLGFSLYPWQRKVLSAVGQGHRTVLRAPNGSGKSSRVIVALTLAFLSEFPNGRAVLTSGSWSQLRGQVFGNLRRFSQLFPKWEFLDGLIRTPQGGTATGLSVDEALKMEGHHRDEGIPTLICVDEGKALLDGVYEAIDKCSWDFRLYASSAGKASGRFFRLFHSQESRFWFKTVVTFADCQHLIDPEHSQERLMDAEVKGTTSPFYRNKWLSEFATDDGDALITLDSLRACQADPPAWIHGNWVSAGCDFAVSLVGDFCCLVICRGNRLEIIDYWRAASPKISAAKFVKYFQDLRLVSSQISADGGGIGQGFLADLEDAGYFVNEIHNGSASEDPDRYVSVASQWWDQFGVLVSKKAVILPTGPWGELLVQQLSDRQKEYRLMNGKLKTSIEPKESMKSRGLDSPDLADAAIMAAMKGYLGTPGALNPKREKRLQNAIEECTRAMRERAFVPP
jgi:phage terminase large subunit